MSVSFQKKTIQLPFDNTYADIWEYKNAFLNGEINFKNFIGAKCPLCGKRECYRQIKEYCRFAIDLFPFKKEKVPVARFLCKTMHRTFSLLPHQLIPYCQYTLASMTRTLLLANKYHQNGYTGYYHAANELHPDCDVTPWLIYQWLSVFIKGFRKAHHLLSVKFALGGISSCAARNRELSLYFSAIAADNSVSSPEDVILVVIWYGRKTNRHLFGTSSIERSAKNK